MRTTLACRVLGGSLENDLQSRQVLYEREGFALRTTIACWTLGVGAKNSMTEEVVNWEIPLHVDALGGFF